MSGSIRQVNFSDDAVERTEELVSREWLVTAGNGSYGCGTIGMIPTRRHHGLLIANLPAPLGRTLSLVQLRAEVIHKNTEDGPFRFWGLETVANGLGPDGGDWLSQFRLIDGIPSWSYRVGNLTIEQTITMPYRSHSVCLHYEIKGATEGARLRLRPVIQFRGHNDSVANEGQVECREIGEQELQFWTDNLSFPLRFQWSSGPTSFFHQPTTDKNCFYRVEKARGYDHVGDLSSPGFLELPLDHHESFTLLASLQPESLPAGSTLNKILDAEYARRKSLIDRVPARPSARCQNELVLAADQFLMTPALRTVDRIDTGPRELDSERRSVIAGYPWFTDWGRDTMISLPGLTLATNRFDEARQILLTFANYIRDGLIPNLFPEGGQEGMYHTADATLWFFQAIAEYEERSGDRALVPGLLPKLGEIIRAHLRGTHYGIHVDPDDDLLVQGQQDVQLTWMDAKAGDWVVTPRRGKAVEINALWYNALFLYCDWRTRYHDILADQIDPSDSELGLSALQQRVRRTQESFNRKFWFDRRRYLYDVVDGEQGNDDSIRPNQLFAISLNHPVLLRERWSDVLQVAIDHLLTPVGLRSLAMTSSDYIGTYAGDVYQRDAAYHQGTVWSWLIGPLVKAWCKTFPEDTEQADTWIRGLEAHLSEACIGQISEIFSGDPPHTPKGCFAQAWGVAEMLESYRVIAQKSQ